MSLPPVIDPTRLATWQSLVERANGIDSIRELLVEPRDYLRLEAAGISFDFSRQRVDRDVVALLLKLSSELSVEQLREAMFSGEHLNTTEDRAVLHVALRAPAHSSISAEDRDVVAEVHETLEHMQNFAERVRAGEWTGATDQAITDVVNIGIGGSDLGPAMAYQALRGFRLPRMRCHFVSNVDPADIESVLDEIDPATTLFIVASKTFTTQETMANAHYARAWLVDALGTDAVDRHFAAVSTNAEAVAEFGIDPANMFGFWEWVGGRYSMTSAIGLSTLIAVGSVNFRALLDGFAAMDEHFRRAPADTNAPLLMGLMAVWNRTFMAIPTTAVLPYSNDLSRFPAYLQQLCMESNGKSVRRDGEVVTYATGGIVWGEPGTNGQHSFFQLLHQGTDDVATDVILVARPSGSDGGAGQAQHDMLVANGLAQASVLSYGLTAQELRDSGTPDNLVAHKMIPGNRPTSVLMLPELDPFSLGALIAAYEHSVFVQGAIWQINSFDQWGVELGKKVAAGILGDIRAQRDDDPALDPATRTSLDELFRFRSRRP